MQQQISALRGRRDAAVDPLERGRLTISIREREAGLAIFQRTQRAAA
jgi:hypothetical protein